MMVPMDRVVTLVACGPDGTVLGQLEPFPVRTPWWQDMEPVHRQHPSVTVLRLLDGVPEQGATMGGHVRYLAEAGPEPRAGASLSNCDIVVADHPLRMPWAATGGPRRRRRLGIWPCRADRSGRPAPYLEPVIHLVDPDGEGESMVEIGAGFL